MAMRSVQTLFPVSVAGRMESTRVATWFSKGLNFPDLDKEPPAQPNILRRIRDTYQKPKKFIKDCWEELKKEKKDADKKSGGPITAEMFKITLALADNFLLWTYDEE